MTGTLAQLIAITSYGNAYLANQNLPTNFYPNNTTFQHCETVNFVAFKKKFFFFKATQTIFATNPHNWFSKLKKQGCQKLRLYFQNSKNQGSANDHRMAGMIGGGGTWVIEAVYKNYSNFWANRWEVGNQNAPDKKIWKVSYGLFAVNNKTINANVDIELATQQLNQTLTEIAVFAQQHNQTSWAETFTGAQQVLTQTNPAQKPYYNDILVASNYTLAAQQLLFAASSAWVFGGMGSWNDLSFHDANDEQTYNQLSAKLYNNINQAILATVNSY